MVHWGLTDRNNKPILNRNTQKEGRHGGGFPFRRTDNRLPSEIFFILQVATGEEVKMSKRRKYASTQISKQIKRSFTANSALIQECRYDALEELERTKIVKLKWVPGQIGERASRGAH